MTSNWGDMKFMAFICHTITQPEEKHRLNVKKTKNASVVVIQGGRKTATI
jgi:hypothetical protein